MTCRGYDSKAVKLPKAVKRAAALISDAHKRGDFIRSFIELIHVHRIGLIANEQR